MTQLYVNNFSARLVAPLAAGDVVMFLDTVAGLPAMAPGDKLTLTIFRTYGYDEADWEIVTVTSRVGNACTIQRAQEGTTAGAYLPHNTVIEARETAGAMSAALALADAAVNTAGAAANVSAAARDIATAANNAATAAQAQADKGVQAAAAAQTQADKGVQAATAAQAQADKGVQAAAAAQATANAALPKTGGTLTGPLQANSITSYTAGQAEPRVELGAANGEPTITMSRWSGQGNIDLAWRWKNDNGVLRHQYSSADRATPDYSDKFVLYKDRVAAYVTLNAVAGLTVSEVDNQYPATATAILPWDEKISAVSQQPYEVMRLRVRGVANVTYAGSFRFHTVTGKGLTYYHHGCAVYGYDTNSGMSSSPLWGFDGTGLLYGRAITGVRIPSAGNETGNGSGWMKIAKVRMGSLGTDFVIRVSGTTTYAAAANGSNGAVTTIMGRIDNDNKIRGSVHTEGLGQQGFPSEVVFGDDGTIYMACYSFYQLSVHADVHPGIWAPQAVEYYSPLLQPPAGNRAVKGWCLNITGGRNFLITPDEISTNLNYRGLNVTPATNNAHSLGLSNYQYTTVFLSTGAINASDARLKRDFRDLTAAEIEAARDIARAIGVYRWNDAVETKAADAREHIGPTVQAAIAIMEAHGLDPFNYGFICHDTWGREVVEHPAVAGIEETPAMEEVPAQIDGEGNVLVEYVPARRAQPAMPAREAYTEVIREAGDRYAFRYDELAMFIAAGHEARLMALEAA